MTATANSTQTRHDYKAVNPRAATSPGQWLVLALSVAYLLAGIAGFFVSHGVGFASSHGHSLLGLDVNPLHNLVHLATGLVGLVAWTTAGRARAFGIALAVAFGAVFIYGLFAVGTNWNVLGMNDPDNVLHLGTAALGALAAVLAHRDIHAGRPVRDDVLAGR